MKTSLILAISSLTFRGNFSYSIDRFLWNIKMHKEIIFCISKSPVSQTLRESSSKNKVNVEFSTSYIRNSIPDLTMVIAAAACVYCVSFHCLITHVGEQLILPIYLHKCLISNANRMNAHAKQTLLTFFTCNLKIWSLV